MIDDDFSFLTGKQADFDNDGKVSFGEYMNDCDDFNRIIRNKNHTSGRYQPIKNTTDEPPKIHCAWGIFGWILALVGCFMPIINTFIYADGEGIGFGIILTFILLAAWIFGFSNRAK